jgi:DNA-directed RNA polymerase specialized sigma24 family protein
MKDYTNSEIRSRVDERIHNERDRAILKRRYCDGVKFEALAEEFDLSTQRIKVIVYKAQDRLFVD